VITEDWYFWSHRLPIARAALRNGYEVVVATRVGACGQKIRDEGYELYVVLDATIGQNGLAQAKVFADVVDITASGLVVQYDPGRLEQSELDDGGLVGGSFDQPVGDRG